MADSVQYHLERMLPELEDFEKRGIFSKQEVKSIIKRRTDLEYSIHRLSPLKSDFLRYIEYEINLERLRKKRKRRMGLDKEDKERSQGVGKKQKQKNRLADFSIQRRIHGLYGKALRKFGGDVELWVQYFEWSKSVGSSKALGRSFARAIQLHPTKPMFWIMAAAWEFEENGNMNSARVLLQRGLRLNPKSEKMWLEYFKLELLFIEKIKERRRILFGDDASKPVPILQPKPTDEASDPLADAGDSIVSLPTLEGEEGTGANGLEEDETVRAATAGDEENVVGEQLTPLQKALLEVTIPRVIFRNAIEAIADDLSFRLEFLRLYRLFGEDTKTGQQEVFESLQRDFSTDATAHAILSERHLSGIEPSSTSYPAHLKLTITEYDSHLTERPTPELVRAYVSFVIDQTTAVDEENLQKYLKAVLRRVLRQADDLDVIPEDVYLAWADREKEAEELVAVDILENAVEKFGGSLKVWEARIELAADDEEKEELFEKACGLVEGEGRTEVWIGYLRWLVERSERVEVDEDGSEGGMDVDGEEEGSDGEEVGGAVVEDRISGKFKLAIRACSPTPSIIPLLHLYLNYTLTTHGLSHFRTVADTLSSTLLTAHTSVRAALYQKCIEIETAQVPAGQYDKLTLKRLRDLWERYVSVQEKSADAWLSYISFELNGTGDLGKATHLYWRATKCVEDKDEFVRRYEEIKGVDM
ncbi:U3 snoRNP protein [Rhizophlyctis rosea]|nr:U3 snoRNP protein [Rhizophlyctis rosea]